MKFTRKIAKSAVAIAALAFGAVYAQNIAVVTHGQANDAFWSVVKNGVEAAAKDSGVKVSYRAPETFDMVAMSRLIDAAVNQTTGRSTHAVTSVAVALRPAAVE